MWDFAPLSFEQVKHYQEFIALALLRYFNPEKYSIYQNADAPDLQSPDKKSGVEVTSATAQDVAAISGDFAKYCQTSDIAKQRVLEQKINHNGGNVEPFGLSYPITTDTIEYQIVRDAILNKNKKLLKYKGNGFTALELFVYYPQTMGPWSEKRIRTLFEETREEQTYDTVFLCSTGSLMVYQYAGKRLQCIPIPKADYDALKIIARMTVAGNLNLNSPVWAKCEE